MVGGTSWPVLGIQPLNHLEHATRIIAEATALLEFDNTKRAKLSAPSLDAFLNSVITLAKKTRKQPSGQEILGKLNSLQPDRGGHHPHQERRQQRTRTACSRRTQCSYPHRLLSRRSPFGHALVSVDAE
ncbi:hypothetical protein BDQ94DRAFT_131264 [Aspergillus welwitschiae]|uniref:Uncharacterized protein n=1 Tax=Aspergillus welwitschiae TaxID=1341132 RepID=A0A3F3PIH5_9EURO|nr:hypothetical protein BDQ94DRAFT_131264 [Aspergillus welwitschiae]RDH26718.1 hypothetical protein BDQ94DRAFT_131264 [Aspergillus welwitschiae]